MSKTGKIKVNKEKLMNSDLGNGRNTVQDPNDDIFMKGCLKCVFLSCVEGNKDKTNNEIDRMYWDTTGFYLSELIIPDWKQKNSKLAEVLDSYEKDLYEISPEDGVEDPSAEEAKKLLSGLINELDQRGLVEWTQT